MLRASASAAGLALHVRPAVLPEVQQAGGRQVPTGKPLGHLVGLEPGIHEASLRVVGCSDVLLRGLPAQLCCGLFVAT